MSDGPRLRLAAPQQTVASGQRTFDASGVSYFAQNPNGQRRKQLLIDTPILRRVFNQAEPETHPGVRGLAPNHVGRKEIPCKYLQSFKENR
jgi:hypothetical protein